MREMSNLQVCIISSRLPSLVLRRRISLLRTSTFGSPGAIDSIRNRDYRSQPRGDKQLARGAIRKSHWRQYVGKRERAAKYTYAISLSSSIFLRSLREARANIIGCVWHICFILFFFFFFVVSLLAHRWEIKLCDSFNVWYDRPTPIILSINRCLRSRNTGWSRPKSRPNYTGADLVAGD